MFIRVLLIFVHKEATTRWMTYRWEHTPEGLEPLLDYFDNTYVSGASTWNVNSITLEGGSRTDNMCEGWINTFAKLVGHAHPTIWRAIDSIRKEQAQIATALLHGLRGEPQAKRVRRHTHQLQSKVHKLSTDRHDNSKTLPDLLKGIGHCVRFK